MEIVNGRNRQCKDLQGGIETLWLFPYVKYSRSQITIVDNVLTLFPFSDVYEFSFVGDTGFTENVVEEEGGKYYNISFSFQIYGKSEVEKFLKKDFRAIALDRQGNYRLLGVYNGLRCESVQTTTGTNKSDFNGFTIAFEGKELIESPYFYELEIVAGFDYLLQENGDYLLQENGFKIIL